jgi:Tol biopolymer transport system component
VLVAAVILALVGLLLFAVGSRQQRLPPPFGLARNGELVSSLDGNIYSIDLASGTRTLLVGGDQYDGGAKFSRDGTRFMFGRGATGCGTPDCGLILAVAKADGTDVRELTPALITLYSSDWSPDGTQIVIESAAPDGTGLVLSVVDVASGAMKSIDAIRLPAPDPDRLETPVHAMWLPPDGREIVFGSEGWRGGGPSVIDPGIYAVHPDGTGLRPLLTRPAHSQADYHDFELSPDGRLIAYRDAFQIHILDLTTRVDRVLPHQVGAEQDGHFSPDGQSILLVRTVAVGSYRFAVLPVDGSSTGIELGPVDPTNSWVIWSPDGTSVLATDPNQRVSRLLPVDGSKPTTLSYLGDPSYQRLAP